MSKECFGRKIEQFYGLNKCEVTDAAVLVTEYHLSKLTWFKWQIFWFKRNWFSILDNSASASELNCCCYAVSRRTLRIENDVSVRTLFIIMGTMAWLCDETEMKYPNSTRFARKLMLPYPPSYIVECGFSTLNDFYWKKVNRLDITNRGNLRLKSTKLVPQIKTLCCRHQARGSH
jgi:hypothetical protein